MRPGLGGQSGAAGGDFDELQSRDGRSIGLPLQFLNDGVLGGAQACRRQGVGLKLRQTLRGLAHCRCAAWTFLVGLNAIGHDRGSQFPIPSLGQCLLYNKGHMP